MAMHFRVQQHIASDSDLTSNPTDTHDVHLAGNIQQGPVINVRSWVPGRTLKTNTYWFDHSRYTPRMGAWINQTCEFGRALASPSEVQSRDFGVTICAYIHKVPDALYCRELSLAAAVIGSGRHMCRRGHAVVIKEEKADFVQEPSPSTGLCAWSSMESPLFIVR